MELGDQFFKVAELEYSFISEKGYLLDVKGSINTNTLIDDLSSNFNLSDIKEDLDNVSLDVFDQINLVLSLLKFLIFENSADFDGCRILINRKEKNNTFFEIPEINLKI